MEGTWRLSGGQNSYDLYILFDSESDILLIIQQNLSVMFTGKKMDTKVFIQYDHNHVKVITIQRKMTKEIY